MRQVADTDLTILIQGESGTGKELVARAIHNLSGRRDGPFIATNVGALPETLIESEVFGYEKGAFSGSVREKPGWFEMAQGGTLFLDEVGEMAAKTQVDLLRVLEQREVRRLGGRALIPLDVRLVAATHRDVDELLAEGKLREDLYYRLNVVPLRIPPLRERRDDIPALVQHFLEPACARQRREPKQVAGAAMRVLCWTTRGRATSASCGTASIGSWPWSKARSIHADDLPREMRTPSGRPDALNLDAAVQEAEKADHPRGPGPVRQPPRARGPAPGHQPPHPAVQAESLLAPVVRAATVPARPRRRRQVSCRPATGPARRRPRPISEQYSIVPHELGPSPSRPARSPA